MSDPLDLLKHQLDLLKYEERRPFRLAANFLYLVGLLGFVVIGLWKFAHWAP